jgi:hypothetical protein
VAGEGRGLELATVNPTGVLGPVLGPDYSPSLGVIARMLDGSMPALLKFASGYVDVRDVASLHLLAMTEDAAAGERFIATAGHSLWQRDIAAVLRERLGERAAEVPTREMPLWVSRLPARVNPQMGSLRLLLGRARPGRDPGGGAHEHSARRCRRVPGSGPHRLAGALRPRRADGRAARADQALARSAVGAVTAGVAGAERRAAAVNRTEIGQTTPTAFIR